MVIVPTDPIDVICTSDLPKWIWGSAGTPPHPGATTWFVLLDTHYKTRLRPKSRKLTAECLQTIIIITPTDPIDVICASDLPKWTYGNAGTPPHPGATTWFVLLDTHYKTWLRPKYRKLTAQCLQTITTLTVRTAIYV